MVGGADLYNNGQIHRDDPYDEFAADDAKIVAGAGDGGDPVKLSRSEEAEGQRVMAKEAFNLVASDKMSLHRRVPDTRDPQCKRVR